MTNPRSKRGRRLAALLAGAMAMIGAGGALASDHLDSPSVIADPAIDIGDIFAWTSPDARRVNLVMTIVGHSFSERARYVFHVDSGPRYGQTRATTKVECRIEGALADCRVGSEQVLGDVSRPEGLASRSGALRVFAGLRDDPFFNNVRGTRDAYNAATAALQAGATLDQAGCPAFGSAVARDIMTRWRHTEGGPPRNLLAGWTPASLVISLDRRLVDKGGQMLAVWGETATAQGRIDRMGRPLTGNALLATLDTAEVSDRMKEAYNRATPATSEVFIPEIEKSVALYDGFDGQCGNALLATAPDATRYLPMAILLTDDRLWVNAASGTCTQLMAVELAALAGRGDLASDCGGRTPNYDAVDVYRSLLVDGTNTGVTDGVDRDEREHSTTVFPFLAAPGDKP